MHSGGSRRIPHLPHEFLLQGTNNRRLPYSSGVWTKKTEDAPVLFCGRKHQPVKPLRHGGHRQVGSRQFQGTSTPPYRPRSSGSHLLSPRQTALRAPDINPGQRPDLFGVEPDLLRICGSRFEPGTDRGSIPLITNWSNRDSLGSGRAASTYTRRRIPVRHPTGDPGDHHPPITMADQESLHRALPVR